MSVRHVQVILAQLVQERLEGEAAHVSLTIPVTSTYNLDTGYASGYIDCSLA